MGTMILQAADSTGPVAATGVPAELLGDAEQAAKSLLELIELERRGIFNGVAGQRFWLEQDSLLEMAKRIVALIEQLRAEQRDAAPR